MLREIKKTGNRVCNRLKLPQAPCKSRLQDSTACSLLMQESLKEYSREQLLSQPVTQGELGQAKLRVVLPAGMLLACGVASLGIWTVELMRIMVCSALWGLAGLAWLWVIGRKLIEDTPRRYAAVALDAGIIGCLAWVGEQAYLAFIWVGLFSAIGHGLRFGVSLAAFASVAMPVALFTAFASSAYWRSMPWAAAGLLIAQLVVPVYTTLLARRIQADKERAHKALEELENSRRVDDLTGVNNRQGFMRALAEAVKDARDGDGGAAVYYLDLDRFKAVNDMLGHQAGDEVLRKVARVLTELTRHDDAVARLGGDEFAVVARGVGSSAAAKALGEKFVQGVRSIVVKSGVDIRIGASVGVVLIPSGTAMAEDEVVRVADSRMYRAKHAGKDQVAMDTLI
jgi:diguanylate cyclase (GGDEF)-like protein